MKRALGLTLITLLSSHEATGVEAAPTRTFPDSEQDSPALVLEAQRSTAVQEDEVLPEVTILDPADGAEVTASTVNVRVNVRSPSGQPVTRVWAKVDGQEVASRTPEYEPADPTGHVLWSLKVPLPVRDCIVEVVAEVSKTTHNSARITVRRKDPPTADRRLYALVIGIAEYAKAEYKLSFADDDAHAIENLLLAQEGESFGVVKVHKLVDSDAILDALFSEFQWLADSAGPSDTVVVFFAGHGVNSDGEYYFLPYEADLAKPIVTMLSNSHLQGMLRTIRGRVLLILDTCRAGAVFGGSDDERRRRVDVAALLTSLAYSDRVLVVFSAAKSGDLSQESAEWGHGAFTKALLEALQGAADAKGNPNGAITISELEGYLQDRVLELTQDAQTPVMFKPPGVTSFTVLEIEQKDN